MISGKSPRKECCQFWQQLLHKEVVGLITTDGCLDGDGYNYFYWDPIWKNNFRLYTGFSSASLIFTLLLKDDIARLYGIKGTINKAKRCYRLKYTKYHSIILLNHIYYKKDLICLKRTV